MTNILGIYAGHNASAALVIDGSVVAAASEERFNGRKNFMGYPREAITYCLESAKITSSDLDIVAIPLLYVSDCLMLRIRLGRYVTFLTNCTPWHG
ncbi:MAG: hypothetical protein EBV45_09665 [Chloroflexi bacterium]|nr:hypothetical protein [Chloroflexota bacterium]